MMRLLSRLWALPALLLAALAQAAPTVTYYYNDLAGSPVVATTGAGHEIWRESYQPYGARTRNEPGAADNKVWFTSRRQDAETGLVYMGARYYDPMVGRFVSTDPAGFDENNLHSFNRYAYGNNNPYRYVDPDGRQALPLRFMTNPGVVAPLVHPSESQQLRKLEGFAGDGKLPNITVPGFAPNDVVGLFVLGGFVGVAAGRLSGLIFDTTGERPQGVPENWVQEPGRKEGHTKWVNPENKHDYVREKPDGTLTQVRNGKAFDADGNRVDLKSPDAHGVSRDKFVFRP